MNGKQSTKTAKNIGSIYNNEAIASLALGLFIRNLKVISIPKTMLILAFLLHEPTAKKLRSISLKRSLEEFVLKNPEVVMGFNSRFIDFLSLSVNSLTILQDANVITMDREFIYFNNQSYFYPEDYKDVGNRSSNMFRSVEALCAILSESDVNTFYLNLKIEL